MAQTLSKRVAANRSKVQPGKLYSAKDALEQDLHKVCWYTMFLYLANGGTVEALGKTYEYMKERFAK